MFIKKGSDNIERSFGFLAPSGGDKKNEICFPFHELQEPAYGAVLAIGVNQMESFLQPADLTGDVTINLTIDPQLTKGAKLYVKLKADDQGDKAVTLSDGFDADAPDLAVESDSAEFLTFIYDGVAFVPATSELYLAALIVDLDTRVGVLEGA